MNKCKESILDINSHLTYIHDQLSVIGIQALKIYNY
jgi:hypothetical protein